MYVLIVSQSSGGQYHFCYILSPDRTKRYSAYVVGWLSILAWWVVTYVSYLDLSGVASDRMAVVREYLSLRFA